MEPSVGVVIGTYGALDDWIDLVERAKVSVHSQSRAADDLVWCHGENLADARNSGAAQCGCEWLIFLDADDELDEGYIEAMLSVEGDVRVPMTLGLYENGVDAYPTRIPWRDLRSANFVVIGAMQRRDNFEIVGGFPDYPILEDWALWRRLSAIGATFVESPAIYKVHVRQGSRNTDTELHGRVYRQILSEVPLS